MANATLFQPRRVEKAQKPKASMIGFGGTPEELATVKELATARGHGSVADYFRSLLAADYNAWKSTKA